MATKEIESDVKGVMNAMYDLVLARATTFSQIWLISPIHQKDFEPPSSRKRIKTVDNLIKLSNALLRFFDLDESKFENKAKETSAGFWVFFQMAYLKIADKYEDQFQKDYTASTSGDVRSFHELRSLF